MGVDRMSFACVNRRDERYDLVVGIDPDRELNGVADLYVKERKLEMRTLSFADTIDWLLQKKRQMEAKGQSLIVIVEAGWLNHSNWHVYRGMSPQKCAAIGASLGANQETGKKLCEMLKYFGIRHIQQKPLPLTIRFGRSTVNKWSSQDGKISHDDLAAFTGYTKRNNQEQRDAALLAWQFAGLPIKYPFK